PECHNRQAAYYIRNMAIAEAADTLVLRCELGWEDVREIMAASRLLTLMRRSWLTAGVMFAALLAESLVLLRLVITRPAAYGAHRGLLLDELIAGASLCLLLVCWSALRVWRLSPGTQPRIALPTGGGRAGQTGTRSRPTGWAGRAPARRRDAGLRASARRCWRSGVPSPGRPGPGPWTRAHRSSAARWTRRRQRGPRRPARRGLWRGRRWWPAAAAGPGSVSWRGCRRWTGA